MIFKFFARALFSNDEPPAMGSGGAAAWVETPLALVLAICASVSDICGWLLGFQELYFLLRRNTPPYSAPGRVHRLHIYARSRSHPVSSQLRIAVHRRSSRGGGLFALAVCFPVDTAADWPTLLGR